MPQVTKRAIKESAFQVSGWKSKKQRPNAQQDDKKPAAHAEIQSMPIFMSADRKGVKSQPHLDASELQSELLARYSADTGVATHSATETSTRRMCYNVLFLEDATLKGYCNETEDSWMIHGTRISTARECTRDEDCELYKLDLESPHGNATMIAGKSGGDAATIRAPLKLHGDEAEDLANVVEQCTQNWSFTFECACIQASSASLGGHPKIGLCSRDDVKLRNVGRATWTFPSKLEIHSPRLPLQNISEQ